MTFNIRKPKTKLQSPFRNEAELLVLKRLDSRLSQNDLANELGYNSGQFISNVERGINALPLENWALLINREFVTENEILEAKQKDLLSKLTILRDNLKKQSESTP